MQEATITNTEGTPSAGVPMLLTQDDLLLEIGKQVAVERNFEKIVAQLSGRIKQAEVAAKVGATATAIAEKANQTSKELSERNLALDRELTEARRKATEAERRAASAEGSLATTQAAHEKDKAALNAAVAKATTDADAAKAATNATHEKAKTALDAELAKVIAKVTEFEGANKAAAEQKTALERELDEAKKETVKVRRDLAVAEQALAEKQLEIDRIVAEKATEKVVKPAKKKKG